MSNVVALRPRQRVIAPASEAFDDAWLTFPESGRLRSSRRQAWPEWCVAIREAGEGALVGAVKRYATEDKEHKREYGAPGFHRWLKWGRWEHWLCGPQSLTVAKRFTDLTIRNALIAATSEAFVISYLDPCEVDGATLVVKTSIAASRLKEHAHLFRSLGFTGMRKGKKPD